MTEFAVEEVTVLTVVAFLNEALSQIKVFKSLRNIQHNQQFKFRLTNVI